MNAVRVSEACVKIFSGHITPETPGASARTELREWAAGRRRPSGIAPTSPS